MKSNQLIKNEEGYSNMVPLVLAVIIGFSILFIGAYVNGTIHQELKDTMPTSGSQRSDLQNRSFDRMNNVSDNWNTGIDIVQVVIIITILASAVGAIFLFTRFR